MAATTSKTGVRLQVPTVGDENKMSWFASLTEGEVGHLRSGALERGGSFTTVDHDKITVLQLQKAGVQRDVLAIRALMSREHLAIIDCYWHPGCDRVRVERERENEERKAAGKTMLSPHSEGERGLRIASLGPLTPAAQDAGIALVTAERLRERERQMKFTQLRLVGGAGDGNGTESVSPGDVGGLQMVSEALRAALNEEPDGSYAVLARRDAALAEVERQKVQGQWKPPTLAPDQLRDAAVRAIREAEKRRDIEFLSLVRDQAERAYAEAGDAYVRARRVVKGKDGEERRQEKADSWIRLNACSAVNAKSSRLLDLTKNLIRRE